MKINILPKQKILRFFYPSVPKRIKRKIPALFKNQARALVIERLNYFNKFYQLSYKRVFIRSQKTRWGSCSSEHNLNFNYRIIYLSPELQDYLIVHELCHLKYFNHGPQFWSLVSETLPNYKELKAQLAKIRL